MHRSRLAGIIIDCQTDDLEGAAGFWSAVFGDARPPEAADGYVKLERQGGFNTEVQLVEHPSRVHLDIESDDIEAEVARLQALGATRVANVKHWVVMQAPTGHRFCVIRAQTPDFEEKAHTWP